MFVLKVPLDNKWTLVQVMAWHRPGNKPLPEQMLIQFTDEYIQHIQGEMSEPVLNTRLRCSDLVKWYSSYAVGPVMAIGGSMLYSRTSACAILNQFVPSGIECRIVLSRFLWVYCKRNYLFLLWINLVLSAQNIWAIHYKRSILKWYMDVCFMKFAVCFDEYWWIFCDDSV